MCIAAAIAGSAVVGAVATTSAAKTQSKAADKAADTGDAQFQQNRQDYAPWREAGITALGQLSQGIAPGGEFMQDFGADDFEQDPGYQFRRDQGMRGIEGGAAARGGLLSGGTLKALNRYNQEFASNEYTNAYNRFNANRDRRYNRLAGVAQTGQTATRDIAQMGTQNAQMRGELGMQAANARGSGYVGAANAAGNAVGQYMTMTTLNKMMGSTPPPNIGSRLGQATMAGATAGYMPSDARLKTNVTKIGTADNGLPLYRYNYVWGGPQHIGHMAHEVAEVFPDAVATNADGFLMVDYSKV